EDRCPDGGEPARVGRRDQGVAGEEDGRLPPDAEQRRHLSDPLDLLQREGQGAPLAELRQSARGRPDRAGGAGDERAGARLPLPGDGEAHRGRRAVGLPPPAGGRVRPPRPGARLEAEGGPDHIRPGNHGQNLRRPAWRARGSSSRPPGQCTPRWTCASGGPRRRDPDWRRLPNTGDNHIEVTYRPRARPVAAGTGFPIDAVPHSAGRLATSPDTATPSSVSERRLYLGGFRPTEWSPDPDPAAPGSARAVPRARPAGRVRGP